MRDAVSVQVLGGLGNQLFQYAAGRAASLRLGCPLVLDVAELAQAQPGRVKRAFMLDAFRIAATVEAGPLDSWEQYNEPAYHFDPAFEAIRRGTRLVGYFQSELYFAAFRNQLRADLQPACSPSAAFESSAALIRAAERPVSLHLRRGDFASDASTHAFHGICGPEHYRRAMSVVEGLCGAPPTYVVFSDDAAEARALFGDLPGAIFPATPAGSPWEDMLLMAQCQHHILANSSFSWWGAWLNPSPNKIVVAPRRWVSAEAMRRLNTADLHPDGTILI